MDENPEIKCVCGNVMKEKEFTSHFSRCQNFKSFFKNFDNQFGQLLKSYSEPPENLLIMRVLLKQYISVLDRRIAKWRASQGPVQPQPINNQNHFGNPNQHNINQAPPSFGNPQPQFQPQFQQPQFQQPYQNPVQSNNYGFQQQQPQQDPDMPLCQICKSPDCTFYDECFHPICISCFTKYAESDFLNMKCKICNITINNYYKKQVLGEQKFNMLEKKFNDIDSSNLNLVECPNPSCKEVNAFEKGKTDYNITDAQGKKLTRQAAEDFAQNRCRCARCQKDFCVNCKETPYHLGYSCAEWDLKKKSKKCRYCDSVINNQNKGPDLYVCNNDECRQRFNISCKKTLPCGHKCFGTCNDKSCPPCLIPDCPGYKNVFDQNVDEYCSICYCEGLGAAPIVVLSCNHYVHYHCVLKRLESRWVGPKITFNHCLCSACNNWYECPSNPVIQGYITKYKALYDTICDMALKRLKFEDLDKDEKLTNPKSPWYGKKLEYALKRLSYYECYTCKKPYFAGRRECGDGPNAGGDNPNRPYDPKDCLCGTHSNLAGVGGISNCPKHGKDFIEYKCRFCCKVASWFCWGTTHFCEDCHKRQCSGDYVSKYTKDKLPKCNPATCELRCKHPPNGEEYALGCSICRNAEENYKKDF